LRKPSRPQVLYWKTDLRHIVQWAYTWSTELQKQQLIGLNKTGCKCDDNIKVDVNESWGDAVKWANLDHGRAVVNLMAPFRAANSRTNRTPVTCCRLAVLRGVLWKPHILHSRSPDTRVSASHDLNLPAGFINLKDIGSDLEETPTLSPIIIAASVSQRHVTPVNGPRRLFSMKRFPAS
jgi:hypothetical protein